MTEQGMYFKAVHVFDVEQTDGPDLPTVDVPTVEATADRLLADLVRVAEQREIAVAFQAIPGGVFGLSKKGSVEIDNTHTTGQQSKTLAHELGHETLHWEDRGPLTREVAHALESHAAMATRLRPSDFAR